MSLDASLRSLGELEFSERGQQLRGRPAFPVGALGELRPERADGRQAQLAQQQRQAGGVDGDRFGDDAAPVAGSSTS